MRASRWIGWVWMAGALFVAVSSLWASLASDPPSGFDIILLEPSSFVKREGVSFSVPLVGAAASDRSDQNGISELRLREDGRELSPHAAHDAIREQGRGRFSHWRRELLISTSDNSDPRTNGRRYEVLAPRAPIGDPWRGQLGLCIFGLLLLLTPFWLRGHRRWRLASAAFLAVGALVALVGLVRSDVGVLLSTGDAVARRAELPTSATERTRFLVEQTIPRLETIRAVESSPRHRRVLEVVSPTTGRPVELPVILQPNRSWVPVDEILPRAPEDLETVELVVRVDEPGSLRIEVSGIDRDGEAVVCNDRTFALETTAKELLRMIRPALGSRCRRVDRITIVTESVAVRLEELRVRHRLDRYQAASQGVSRVTVGGDLRTALWQSQDGWFRFPRRSTNGGLLKVAVGAVGESSSSSLEWAIHLEGELGERVTLAHGSVRPAEPWREVRVELPADAGALVFEGASIPRRAALLWAGSRIIDVSQSPRRVVMVLVDTLRADALRCYGNTDVRTPALDRLAGQGARFERAFSQAHWTRASVASFMTGEYIETTRVLFAHDRLVPSFDTLAERFRAAGFYTLSVSTNSNTGPHARLDQGFAEMHLAQDMSRAQREETTVLVDDTVLPVLQRLADEDLFFYLHLMEVHGPYGPMTPPEPNPWLSVEGRPVVFDPIFDREWNTAPSREQRIRLYYYDVEQTDAALGRLFDALDSDWGSQDAIIAVTSDHGEWLGEKGMWGHSFTDLEPVAVRVPLILRAAGQIPAATVASQPTELRHLGATLLELAGVTASASGPASSTAASLLPWMADGSAPVAPVALASAYTAGGTTESHSLFSPTLAYVGRSVGGESRVDLLDITTSQPVAPPTWVSPILRHLFAEIWSTHLVTQERLRSQHFADDDATLWEPQVEAELKALGYVD